MTSIFLVGFILVGCGPIKQSKPISKPRTTATTKPKSASKNTPAATQAKGPIAEKKPIGKTDPNFLKGLPKWEDISPPKAMPNPTAGLGLVLKTDTCFKEFFADRSVHPHVRKYGGRLLEPNEKAMGRMILCPEERKKKLLVDFKKAGII